MDPVNAVILGGSGFAGAELLRRLLEHPHVSVIRVCAADHVGEPISRALPHLTDRTELVFENPPMSQAVDGADVVLMGLPHGASVELVQQVLTRPTRVIDLSGAFRLRSESDYARYYGAEHPAPELLERFVYGLPEYQRSAIKGARYIASPGCFATAISLSLLPFARAGLIQGAVHTLAVTGSSGAGATPTRTTHHPVRSQNLRAYRALNHQHCPEIEATLRAAGAPGVRLSFVPVAGPLARGILSTSFFEVPAEYDTPQLLKLLAAHYEKERFVRVVTDRLPEVVAVSGSNYAEVGVCAAEPSGDRRTVSVFGALDNLIKGGAGQAIQNLNLMLGFDEATTLTDAGPYP